MGKTAKYLLLAFIFMSCDSAIEPPASSNDYFPLTVGSSWTYQGDLYNLQDKTFSFSCIDTQYFEKSVRVLLDRSVSAGMRYYKSGDTIFMLWSNDGSTTPFYVPYLVPKIDAKWSTEFSGGLWSTTKVTSTVQSTNDTLTVLGAKYSDVMKVSLESIYTVLDKIDTVVGVHYFSKGVGLIESTNSPYSNLKIVGYSIR